MTGHDPDPQATRRGVADAFIARMEAKRWRQEHPDWRRWVIPCDCRDGCDAPLCTKRED